ncbi:uncharacterized protein P174DRAFT_425495 [Aspergillus novofumigatus IBT 16806]|uniref:Carrier domain-containing protein n=1 Tax=Aspergillus novofumigatus (strain IBT 16806) TaxID=1392255 RepID=A0A2I1BUC0_ASPN1|nr:uncharacterized protein P174DRAFT_425495 [Aspergillus novofumigatus IBT 16806]PKX88944.1 hypothetical protein P174DRAFT_425495 [Aspergillus novofumigatus IBT 16806]
MSNAQVPSTSEDLERPGVFPKLRSPGNEGRQTASITLGPNDSKVLMEVARGGNPSLLHLLKTAWPILLADYVDSKTVSFGILSSDAGNDIVEQWSAVVNPEQPISRAVTLEKLHEWPLAEVGHNEESIVPVLLEKSKWAVVAILGVLKAGAAFVLLDISYPAGRLRDICEDVQAQVVMQSVEAPIIDRPMNIVAVGEDLKDWVYYPPPRAPVTSKNAAYVSYTSGSTGKPKGVVIEHGSFCTNAMATSKIHNLSSSSRVLQYASFAFDVSIQESEACGELQVNWAELTPSVARLLHPKEVPSIRTLVLGGEPTSSIDISRWQNLRLISAYGPAECTIVSTVQPHVQEPGNIGRSYGGTCWIVDKDNHHRLLPIGAVGELVIGGPIVGHYRFYRTGDLVRYNVDGDIIYCGRKDTQVKIHGQRMELGEIEYHARTCLGHDDLIVELGLWAYQRPFLVLFMAPKGQVAEDACPSSLFCEPNDEFRRRILHLKARLRNRLPEYMIPTVYIPGSGIPLSRTGKVDRRLLRSAFGQLSDAQVRKYHISDPSPAVESPLTPAEKTIRELLATVLQLPEAEIGIDDSIFQLGADSITAISLVAEARRRGLDMMVASIFQSRSIRKLVAVTDNICACSTSPAAKQCIIALSQIEDMYPCTPLQEAMMGFTMRNPGSLQAQIHFRLPMALDIARFKDAWGKVIAARLILRTRIVQLDTAQALQVIVRSEEKIPWHFVKHVHEVVQTFMLLGDPLIQLCMDSEPDETVQLIFVLTMHHAVFDKWSYRIILEEYTQSNDVVFGVTVNGRSAPVSGIHELAAPTIATIPLRTVLQPDVSVQETLVRMQEHATRLIPFEHTGLRWIKSFSAGAALACDFKSLLVIQPPVRGGVSDGLFGEPLENDDEQLKFSTHPLTLICELADNCWVDVTAVIDSAVTSPDEAQAMLQQFAGLFSKINDNLERPVGSIIKSLPKDSAGRPDREGLRAAASNLCRKIQQDSMFPTKSEAAFSRPIHLSTAQNIVAHVLGLKVEDVDSEDDFFVFGGDSSTAMQMVMLCRKEGFSLTVRDIFQQRMMSRIASKLQPLARIKPPPDHAADWNMSSLFSLLCMAGESERARFEADVKTKLGIASMDAVEDAYPCTTSYTIWEVTATGRDSAVCPFRLRDAWLSLVHRHSALRTILIDNPLPGKSWKKIHIVLHGSPSEDTVFSGVSDDTMHRPNLMTGTGCPPFKFAIYQTQQNRVYCKLEGNQAFLDATSLLIILQDLAQAYTATLSSAPGPPYRSVVEYFDYTSEDEGHADYWKKQMAAAEPCIFPSLKSEGPGQDTLSVTRIEIRDAVDLRQYCVTSGFVLSNVLQVAWGLTLQSYTHQNIVCFGTLVSGRDLPLQGVHETIGPFFNVLPCQLNLSCPDHLLRVLGGNQVEIANRLSYQHYCLNDILRQSNFVGQRLFNTCISLEQQLSSLQVDGICFTEIDTREPTEYILLSVIDKQSTLEARLTYFSSIMSDQQAAEVVRRFEEYVSHILHNTSTS